MWHYQVFGRSCLVSLFLRVCRLIFGRSRVLILFFSFIGVIGSEENRGEAVTRQGFGIWKREGSDGASDFLSSTVYGILLDSAVGIVFRG